MKRKIQTIEKTGKFYKGMKLIGLVLVIVGFFGIWPLIPVGIVVFIVAKIFAWWFHG